MSSSHSQPSFNNLTFFALFADDMPRAAVLFDQNNAHLADKTEAHSKKASQMGETSGVTQVMFASSHDPHRPTQKKNSEIPPPPFHQRILKRDTLVAFLAEAGDTFWLGRVDDESVHPRKASFMVRWLVHSAACNCEGDKGCSFDEWMWEPDLAWRPAILSVLKPNEYTVRHNKTDVITVSRAVIDQLHSAAEAANDAEEEVEINDEPTNANPEPDLFPDEQTIANVVKCCSPVISRVCSPPPPIAY